MTVCRAVLILTCLLTAFMPITEHYCRWDRFLQGGPDAEFGILCLLLFAGLVLLMAHRATSPFLLLLAHRLIAFPLRCLFIFGHPLSASLLCQAQDHQGTPSCPSFLLETPLRI